MGQPAFDRIALEFLEPDDGLQVLQKAHCGSYLPSSMLLANPALASASDDASVPMRPSLDQPVGKAGALARPGSSDGPDVPAVARQSSCPGNPPIGRIRRFPVCDSVSSYSDEQICPRVGFRRPGWPLSWAIQ